MTYITVNLCLYFSLSWVFPQITVTDYRTSIVILLLAQQFDKNLIYCTRSVSEFDRIHIDGYSGTSSTTLIIFTRSPEPRGRNKLPCVPSPLSICLLAADPDPLIQVGVLRGWHVLEKAARVDGFDKAVVV